jgi:hypothetical protein
MDVQVNFNHSRCVCAPFNKQSKHFFRCSMKDRYMPTASKTGTARGDTQLEIGRVISVLIALVGLAIAYRSPSVGVFHFTLAFVVLPLGCIWYGGEIGGFTADVEVDTPNLVGSLITYAGWITLLGMLAVLIWPLDTT